MNQVPLLSLSYHGYVQIATCMLKWSGIEHRKLVDTVTDL